MSYEKVFCIGFHKTGTTSLRDALTVLGFKVTGPNGIYNENIAAEVHDMACELVEEYDAFQDNPWPIIYRELDGKYPGNKFILTLRPSGEWIKSAVKYFGNRETPMRVWIYGAGSPVGNEAIYLERYERHNREVQEYFKDRPDDLLVLDFSHDLGWTELCSFLDKEIPDTPFPHANKADYSKAGASVSARVLKKIKGSIARVVDALTP